MSLNVGNLIDWLRELPSDMPVYVGDYYYEVREGISPVKNVDDIFTIGPIQWYEDKNDGQPYLYLESH